ncbi:uncharacterized protein LOC135476788 [Liolophura sinensis]|uniref:uncharacterized protein LOC135476788 n=1 Tax=Liolophura sinensis TaxID=3198878 RepID=UPI0031588407
MGMTGPSPLRHPWGEEGRLQTGTGVRDNHTGRQTCQGGNAGRGRRPGGSANWGRISVTEYEGWERRRNGCNDVRRRCHGNQEVQASLTLCFAVGVVSLHLSATANILTKHIYFA